MKKIFLSLLAIAATGSLMAGVTPYFNLELGYDHGLAHVRNNYYGDSFYSDFSQMDGFHFGGDLQLDFLEGQDKPGLLIGVNYQFLANNLINHNPTIKAAVQDIKDKAKAAGASRVQASDYMYMHTIQIPVRFLYTHQITNDWRFFALTGPQIRLHVSLTDTKNLWYEADGKRNGSYSNIDYIAGKETKTTWVNGLENKTDLELDERKHIDCFDMSWGFGIGFGWKALSLQFTYDLGMINLYNNMSTKAAKQLGQYYRFNSDALAVTLGFRIK